MELRLVKLYADGRIEVCPFPTGDGCGVYDALNELIGGNSVSFESVYPRRLYTELGWSNLYGQRVHMLVDEDGHRKELSLNLRASWLYEADKHGVRFSGMCCLYKSI